MVIVKIWWSLFIKDRIKRPSVIYCFKFVANKDKMIECFSTKIGYHKDTSYEAEGCTCQTYSVIIWTAKKSNICHADNTFINKTNSIYIFCKCTELGTFCATCKATSHSFFFILVVSFVFLFNSSSFLCMFTI